MLGSEKMKRENLGFSLIEVMVALFVLAVGMLGILNMQVQAGKHNKTAYLYSQAVFLAQDISERIRANGGAAAGSYLLDADTSITPCDTACTPGALAASDLALWSAEVSNALPAGIGTIEGIGGGAIEIKIQFEDGSSQDRGQAVGEKFEYILVTEVL